jgi:fructosamine-3-kinase
VNVKVASGGGIENNKRSLREEALTGTDEALRQVLGVTNLRLEPMSGGITSVYRVQLPDGSQVVAKTGTALETEAYMLRYLAEHSRLPVPKPLYASDTLLVMEYIEGGSAITSQAESHAAELLADLHSISAPQYGLERDTLIGGLPQPNPLTERWLPFFREQRLLYMAREAVVAGRLPAAMFGRVEKLAAQLDRWLTEPPAPSLLHGDIWSGNVLARDGRIVGLIDPAIYYGHAEIELAFITLFSTFGDTFFRRYHELRPIEDGFFEERRDLYNLYPLLVHIRLFGGGYMQSVDRVLRRYGC